MENSLQLQQALGAEMQDSLVALSRLSVSASPHGKECHPALPFQHPLVIRTELPRNPNLMPLSPNGRVICEVAYL